MFQHPVFGIGQEHWGDYGVEFGWPAGKEAHSLWFQTAAELGIPGVSFLAGFYFLTIWCTWQAGRRLDVPWMPMLSRMMLVSLIGFAVSAGFVTVEGFELPVLHCPNRSLRRKNRLCPSVGPFRPHLGRKRLVGQWPHQPWSVDVKHRQRSLRHGAPAVYHHTRRQRARCSLHLDSMSTTTLAPELPISLPAAESQESHLTVIEPTSGWRLVDFRELYRYRDLLYFLTFRSIRVLYAQSAIGIGWAVLQPLCSMIVFTIIFGYFAGIKSDGMPYAVFSLTALVPWTYFSNALLEASNSLVNQSQMITKVYFPARHPAALGRARQAHRFLHRDGDAGDPARLVPRRADLEHRVSAAARWRSC